MMRRMISWVACGLLLISPSWSLAQEQAEKQAEKQAPTQKVEPTQKAVQAPTQKATPVQKAVQAPTQKHHQKHVQKGARQGRLGLLRRG